MALGIYKNTSILILLFFCFSQNNESHTGLKYDLGEFPADVHLIVMETLNVSNIFAG